MGWEMVIYKDRHEHIRDSDVLLLRHFLQRTLADSSSSSLETDDETFAALHSYIDGWSYAGNGVVLGFGPDEFIGDCPARLHVLRNLLNRTSNDISRFGDAIPLSYLDDLNGVVAGYTRDLPLKFMYSAIGKFLEVLA